MAIFEEFNRDKINELLRTANRILNDDIAILKREDEEDLFGLWNEIKSNFDDFMENHSNSMPEDIERDSRAKFRYAMLKIAAAFYVNGKERKGITNKFSEREKHLVVDLEEFKVFNFLTVAVIIDKVARSEGKIYDLVEKYIEKGYGKMDKVLDDNEIPKDIMYYVNKEYSNVLEKIKESVIEYQRKYPGGIHRAFKELENRIKEVHGFDEKRKGMINEANEIIKNMENQLSDADNDKYILEDKISLLEREIMRGKMEKETLNEKINFLEDDKNRLLKSYSEIESRWNDRYKEIEKIRTELNTEEDRLTSLKETYKQKLEGENQQKIEEELKKIEEMKLALTKKENDLQTEKELMKNEENKINEKIEGLKKLEEGIVERFVMSGDAKVHELNYIGRFNEKMHLFPLNIYDPINKKEHTVNSWNRHEKWTQEMEIYEKFKTRMNYNEVINTIPLGTTSVYKITQKKYVFFGEEKTKVVIEAATLNHWNNYCETGFDTNPAALSDLTSVLMSRIDRAELGNYFHVIGISSPTGWSKKVLEYVNSDEFHKNFTDRHVSLALIDPETGEIFYNRTDKRLAQFEYLFKPEFDTEKVERCKNVIKEDLNLIIDEFVTVNEFAEKNADKGFDKRIVKKAMYELEKEGVGRFKFVEGVGFGFKKKD